MDATTRERQMCLKRVRRENEEIMRDPLPNVMCAVAPDNHLNWYCLIHNLHEECYEGGEYLFQIRLSPRYPFEPPDFYMLTPSGRFDVQKKLCFSNSSMHPEQWSPMWTIRTMIMGFISFFLDMSTSGIGHLISTIEAKKAFAEQSKAFNLEHNAEIVSMILQQNGVQG